MPSELERKVDEIGDGLIKLNERVAGIDARISTHDLDDRQRHTELRQDMRDMRTSLFRLLFAGLLVIVICLGLMGALVGTRLYLDSGHVEVASTSVTSSTSTQTVTP